MVIITMFRARVLNGLSDQITFLIYGMKKDYARYRVSHEIVLP